MHTFEKIHTIEDWHDGPISGIAHFRGVPHSFLCLFQDKVDNHTEVYALRPLDAETFALAMQCEAIWLRCEAAVKSGRYTLDQLQPTWPATPEDSAEHRRLMGLIGDRLVVDPATPLKARGEFGKCSDDPEHCGMRWTSIE